MTKFLTPITHDNLAHDEARIRHGFFTRKGGLSNGIYASLNVGLGSDDDQTTIQENRHRVARHLGADPESLYTPYQVHSPNVWTVTENTVPSKRPEADAVVTNRTGVAIGILTADCGPVLFADTKNEIIGAAHAGWKGATGGVLENTLEAMEALGADRNNIKAVLGPTISQDNYEVGPEFVDRLIMLDKLNSQYLKPSQKTDHAMFDLPTYIVARLSAAGVSASWTGDCTYADDAEFFSYRRKTHLNEPDYGRQISAIAIG